MKIYSWNILFQNKKIDEAIRFIEGLDFDILCLQEVPERLLPRLESLAPYVVYGPDVTRLLKEKEHNFLVLLSTYPITAHASFPLQLPVISRRVQAFVWAMQPLGWSKIENRGGLWADVSTPSGKSMRIFNLHLTLSHPKARAEEFTHAMNQGGGVGEVIVCGDFNILESIHITVLNWLSGGGIGDWVHVARERANVEKIFSRLGLINPLRFKNTHRVSQSQLDHILVPKGATVVDARVLREHPGSDHNVVCVELADTV